jgi:hypothetical protein
MNTLSDEIKVKMTNLVEDVLMVKGERFISDWWVFFCDEFDEYLLSCSASEEEEFGEFFDELMKKYPII